MRRGRVVLPSAGTGAEDATRSHAGAVVKLRNSSPITCNPPSVTSTTQGRDRLFPRQQPWTTVRKTGQCPTDLCSYPSHCRGPASIKCHVGLGHLGGMKLRVPGASLMGSRERCGWDRGHSCCPQTAPWSSALLSSCCRWDEELGGGFIPQVGAAERSEQPHTPAAGRKGGEEEKEEVSRSPCVTSRVGDAPQAVAPSLPPTSPCTQFVVFTESPK